MISEEQKRLWQSQVTKAAMGLVSQEVTDGTVDQQIQTFKGLDYDKIARDSLQVMIDAIYKQESKNFKKQLDKLSTKVATFTRIKNSVKKLPNIPEAIVANISAIEEEIVESCRDIVNNGQEMDRDIRAIPENVLKAFPLFAAQDPDIAKIMQVPREGLKASFDKFGEILSSQYSPIARARMSVLLERVTDGKGSAIEEFYSQGELTLLSEHLYGLGVSNAIDKSGEKGEAFLNANSTNESVFQGDDLAKNALDLVTLLIKNPEKLTDIRDVIESIGIDPTKSSQDDIFKESVALKQASKGRYPRSTFAPNSGNSLMRNDRSIVVGS